jgi:micrococcal nuclease
VGVGETIRARTVSVTDGDTIKVRTINTGRRMTVRLLGIDTPETVDHGKPVECGGRSASAAMTKLALLPIRRGRTDRGRNVTLTTDPTQARRDRFGRLLAYVKRDSDGRDLGAAQISAGWSAAFVFDRPFQKLATYMARQNAAKAARRGIWGGCGGNFHRAP